MFPIGALRLSEPGGGLISGLIEGETYLKLTNTMVSNMLLYISRFKISGTMKTNEIGLENHIHDPSCLDAFLPMRQKDQFLLQFFFPDLHLHIVPMNSINTSRQTLRLNFSVKASFRLNFGIHSPVKIQSTRTEKLFMTTVIKNDHD